MKCTRQRGQENSHFLLLCGSVHLRFIAPEWGADSGFLMAGGINFLGIVTIEEPDA